MFFYGIVECRDGEEATRNEPNIAVANNEKKCCTHAVCMNIMTVINFCYFDKLQIHITITSPTKRQTEKEHSSPPPHTRTL